MPNVKHLIEESFENEQALSKKGGDLFFSVRGSSLGVYRRKILAGRFGSEIKSNPFRNELSRPALGADAPVVPGVVGVSRHALLRPSNGAGDGRRTRRGPSDAIPGHRHAIRAG